MQAVDYVPPVFKKGCIKEETNQTRKDRNMDFLFALRVIITHNQVLNIQHFFSMNKNRVA
jgi:hypothetical protein